MNIEALCYIGLLRFPSQLEASFAMLPDQQRAEAMVVLETMKSLPKAELLRKWGKLRDEEYAGLLRNSSAQLGLRLDELPPSLRQWISSRLADQNG